MIFILYIYKQDSDVHITFEDQQKINKFARLNARVDEYRDELKAKQVSQFFLSNQNYKILVTCKLRM